jgi:hypothetical protein
MTFDEAEKGHKKLWTKLARTGGRSKREALSNLKLDFIQDDCFACEFVDRRANGCAKCPITWRPDQYQTVLQGLVPCSLNENSETLYSRWFAESSKSVRKSLAKQIAELPWEER